MNFYPTYAAFSKPYENYKCYITYAKSNAKTDFDRDCKTFTNNLFEINLRNSLWHLTDTLHLDKHSNSEVFKGYKIRDSN